MLIKQKMLNGSWGWRFFYRLFDVWIFWSRPNKNLGDLSLRQNSLFQKATSNRFWSYCQNSICSDISRILKVRTPNFVLITLPLFYGAEVLKISWIFYYVIRNFYLTFRDEVVWSNNVLSKFIFFFWIPFFRIFLIFVVLSNKRSFEIIDFWKNVIRTNELNYI